MAQGGSRTDDGSDEPRRRTRPTKPWYRQGKVWFAIIVAEAAVAWGASVVFANTPENMALDGADVPRFCADVVGDQRARIEDPAKPNEPASESYGRQAAALRALVPSAPDQVRLDIEVLAGLTEEVVVAARGFEDRLGRDNVGSVLPALASIQRDLSLKARLPDIRFQATVQRACSIDLARDLPPEQPVSAADPSATTLPVTEPIGPTTPNATEPKMPGTETTVIEPAPTTVP